MAIVWTAQERTLIETMDQHPGNSREDHDLLRREPGPCSAGLLVLCYESVRLTPDEIRRRGEEPMAHQRALLARVDRCTKAIS